MQLFPNEETTFLFPGPVGNIEIIAHSPREEKQIAATVIICHPHPLFGGTMNNKVVTTLARVFHDLGLRTVRFNFRGVGKTEGIHDQGVGEMEDVLAIANWIKKIFPNDKIWLAGFSFGGFVATMAATQLYVEKLITVAPQVSRFAGTNVSSITAQWLVVQGELDDVVSPAEVYAWINTIEPKPALIRLPNAGHFFHGQLLELRKAIEKFVDGKNIYT